MRNRLTIGSLALFAFTTAADAQTTRTVCASGCQYTTIQAAVDAAGEGDVIEIAQDLYSLDDPIQAGEKSLTLRGELVDGQPATILDGNEDTVVLSFWGDGHTVTLENLRIQNGEEEAGGAEFDGVDAVVTNCEFVGNFAEYEGGGILHENGALEITGCRFESNESDGDGGGGVYCYRATGDVTITDCRFVNNDGDGAGINIDNAYQAEGASVTIADCHFEGNTGGAAIHLGAVDYPTVVRSCTFAGNQAAFEFWASEDVTVSSCIAWCNADDVVPEALADEFIDGGGNRFSDNCADCTADTDEDGIPDCVDGCPGGDDLVDTDGDLVPDDCDDFPNDENESVDSDGDGVGDNADICPDGDDLSDADGDLVMDGCDAFPYDENESVDSDGDGVGDNSDACPGGDDSADDDGDSTPNGCDEDYVDVMVDTPGGIRGAIEDAADGDVIRIGPGTFAEGEILIDKTITLIGTVNGRGEPTTILDGENSNRIMKSASPGLSLALENLVFQGGFVSTPGNRQGGGLHCVDTAVAISNCHFADNAAGVSGGGIYLEDCEADFAGCLFRSNRADEGSAIEFDTCVSTLDSCTFEENFGFASANSFNVVQILRGSSEFSGCWFTGHQGDWSLLSKSPTAMLTLTSCSAWCNTIPITPNPLHYQDGGDNCFSDSCTECSPDSDGDGVPNDEDICPGGDDLLDADGDLVPDECDDFPNDETESADSDGDGVGDNADACPGSDDLADADGDLVPDACDDFPNDDTESADSDRDGVGDNADECPNDPDRILAGYCGCGNAESAVQGDVDCDGDLDADDVRILMTELGIVEHTPGDANGDGIVDLADRDAVNDALGLCDADIDGDGEVNGADLSYVLGYWGLCSAP